MKVIAIGDPHIKTDNIDDVNLFLQRLEDLIIKTNPDFCVILGDILHTHERLHSIALNKAYEFINMVRQHTLTFALVGNHDMYNNQQYLNTNHWMNGMKEWHNVRIIDTVQFYEVDNHKFVFCPYVPPGRFVEALDTAGNWSDADCIFAHQEFAGCKMGAVVSIHGDDWPDSYPRVVSGHIHAHQYIGRRVYYPGSAMQHAFGESEKNIIPILEWVDGEYNLEEVDLELPRKKIIYVDMKDIDKVSCQETVNHEKITVRGSKEDFKAFKKTKKYKDITKSGRKVVFKPDKIELQQKYDYQPDDKDFYTILQNLISKEQDNHLIKLWQKIRTID